MSYRISYIRGAGWTRLGVAAGVACAFSAPMWWAMGSFGVSGEALHRAIIFAVSGLWCCIATGLTLGWAVQGFVIRSKPVEDEGDEPAAGHHPSPPASPPPARGHKPSSGH